MSKPTPATGLTTGPHRQDPQDPHDLQAIRRRADRDSRPLTPDELARGWRRLARAVDAPLPPTGCTQCPSGCPAPQACAVPEPAQPGAAPGLPATALALGAAIGAVLAVVLILALPHLALRLSGA